MEERPVVASNQPVEDPQPKEDRLDRADAIFELHGDPCPWARGGESPDRPSESALTLLIEEIRAIRQRVTQIEKYFPHKEQS